MVASFCTQVIRNVVFKYDLAAIPLFSTKLPITILVTFSQFGTTQCTFSSSVALVMRFGVLNYVSLEIRIDLHLLRYEKLIYDVSQPFIMYSDKCVLNVSHICIKMTLWICLASTFYTIAGCLC